MCRPPGGICEVLGQDDVDPVRIDRDAGRRLDDLLDRLHARPDAGEAAQRERMQAHVEDVLHARREEHRQAAGLEDVVALVRRGRALGDVVVAGEGDHAAVLGGAGQVGVLEDVGAAVDAGALAVPDAEHAVEALRLGVEVELLRAPDRGRAELLVDAGLEDDVLRREMALGLPQGLVVAAERRAAIAADEAAGLQAEHRIPLLLQHRQSHQRLRSAHEGPAVLEAVLVVEGDALERLANRVGKGCVHRGFRLREEARQRSVPARLVTGGTPESVGIRHGRGARGAGHATVTKSVRAGSEQQGFDGHGRCAGAGGGSPPNGFW